MKRSVIVPRKEICLNSVCVRTRKLALNFFESFAFLRNCVDQNVLWPNRQTSHIFLESEYKFGVWYQGQMQADAEGHNVSPHTKITRLLSMEWLLRSLQAAVMLGVPDALKQGPLHFSDLAQAVKADPDRLQRVLRALAAHGIFSEDVTTGVYSHNSVSICLTSDHPTKVAAWTLLQADDAVALPWVPKHFVEGVRRGGPSFPLVFGQEFWNYSIRTRPEVTVIFQEAMSSHSAMHNAAIASVYDFSGFNTIVDVGGGIQLSVLFGQQLLRMLAYVGYGTLLQIILRKNPSIKKGILFDLPAVISQVLTNFLSNLSASHPLKQATIQNDDQLKGRVECVEGNFFKSVPASADCYLATTVLHDWSDEHAAKILASIHHAAPIGAKLVLGEVVVPLESRPTFSKLMDCKHCVWCCVGRVVLYGV